MSDDENDDYEIGYGKPPKSTQFKKGQSGNPRGRPKKLAPTVAGQVARLMGEQYSARINGEVVSMTGEEMIARRLVENALKGDAKAFEKVHQLANQHAEAEASRAQAAEGPRPLRVEFVHAKIPEEECYKKPGERISYIKEKNTLFKESWPGYLPDDVAEADDSSPVDTWNEPDAEEPDEDDADDDDTNDEDVGAYGLCVKHDI